MRREVLLGSWPCTQCREESLVSAYMLAKKLGTCAPPCTFDDAFARRIAVAAHSRREAKGRGDRREPAPTGRDGDGGAANHTGAARGFQPDAARVSCARLGGGSGYIALSLCALP
jgi:hypothetical protein